MPPISPQSSRGGLITAVVIFAILFVTSTVFAFIYSARAARAEDDLGNLRKNYNGIVAASALNGPEVDALKAARGADGSGFSPSDTILSVATRQTAQLAALLGGKDAAGASSTARKALDGAKDKLKATDVKLGNDLSGSITTLASAVVARDALILQLTGQRDENVGQVTAAKQQQAELVAVNEKAVAEARAATDAVTADTTAYRGTKDEQVAAIEKERDAERAKAAEDAALLNTTIAEKDGAIKKLQKDIEAIRQRLAGLRGNVSNVVVQQSDGTIIRLPGQSIAYIDLGAGDQIAPGLTFEVYDKGTGVPAPAGSDSTDLPKGKASIEVLRVGGNSSECRITRLQPGEQLVQGDVIANLVYDRNTKYTFHVFGNFDLDQNGVSTPGDANVVKQLITQWGAKVSDQVNVNTDFVVLGVEPVVPAFTAEELEDPVNKKKSEDAQAAATAYADVLQKAGELNIPVLNQNRFLYYVGYFEQAKR